MKINLKVVFLIIAVSSLIGLAYNYFAPGGIPLIAEEKTLKWADDSLLDLTYDGKTEIKDTSGLTTEYNVKEEKSFNETEIVKEKKTEEAESKKEDEKVYTEPVAINLTQAYNLYKNNILFIDAREPADYEYAHIKNAINIPFDHFEEHKYKLEQIEKKRPLVIYCAGTDCDLSILLGNILFEEGYNKTYIFFGGWTEWTEANYPVEGEIQTE